MHALIGKLFRKRGISSVNDLTPEEKEQYDRWDAVLSGKTLTLEDVKLFTESQVSEIEGQLRNTDNPQLKNERLVTLLSVYTTLRDMFTAPQKERESMEKYLQSLLKE